MDDVCHALQEELVAVVGVDAAVFSRAGSGRTLNTLLLTSKRPVRFKTKSWKALEIGVKVRTGFFFFFFFFLDRSNSARRACHTQGWKPHVSPSIKDGACLWLTHLLVDLIYRIVDRFLKSSHDDFLCSVLVAQVEIAR